jgi:hypothetical protein
VLIRDVAYDLLPRAARRERHEQVARYLEGATAEIGEAGAAIARHWRDAGDAARALEYFVGPPRMRGRSALGAPTRGELSRYAATGGKSAGVTSPAIS